MKVHFKSNLDLMRFEQFPIKLSCRPMVGDLVRSTMKWPCGFQLELIVCRIILTDDCIIAELTIPPYFENLTSFYKVYEKITGRKFI